MLQSGIGFKSFIQKKDAIGRKERGIRIYCRDETVLKAGSENIWLWVVATEPENGQFLSQTISTKRGTCL